MDKIEEEAMKSNPVLIEPTEEELTDKPMSEPMTIETELPHVQAPPVAGNIMASSVSSDPEPFRPEPGYIRGQLMRQAAVLSEMDAFCSQNHGFLADDALAQLKTAQNSIRAAWRSLLVAAVKLEE